MRGETFDCLGARSLAACEAAGVDRGRDAGIVEGLTPGVSPGACKPRPLPVDFSSLISYSKHLSVIC